MATITTLNTSDNGAVSRVTINDNFTELNTKKVETTGNETIAGVKTFSSSPIVPTPTTDTQASTKKYVDDENLNDVHLTGDQTVAGVKTFSSSPIVPAPTTDLQVATKKYVDDVAIAGVADASTTTKGIVEEATQAEVDAGTAAGGTSARLFINPSTVSASETTSGIVEEATDAEVTAGTATGGTGRKLFVTPAKLKTYPIIETTAGTTHSLTTIDGQRVIVWAKGAILDGGFNGGSYAINLKYNGVAKDVTYQQLGNTNNKYGFALMYTETPGAATANITVDFTAPGGGGTLSDVKIIVQKF
jgi:hypothetical protein